MYSQTIASEHSNVAGHISLGAHNLTANAWALDVPSSQPLALLTQLQTTLDVDQLIQIFVDHIKPLIAWSGVRYSETRHNLEIDIGRSGIHTASYQLMTGSEELGMITLRRNNRFDEHELNDLESLLSHLIYPLRNALRYAEAIRSATIDSLTGVNNRTTMESNLEREIQLASRNQNPLSIIMLDIDHFKSINDHFGHDIGDCALRHLSATMQKTVRTTDVIYRFGGEEFLILLNNTDVHGAKLLAERIRLSIEQAVLSCGESTLTMTISLGAASWNLKENHQHLIKRADQALYSAKSNGRNQVVIAND